MKLIKGSHTVTTSVPVSITQLKAKGYKEVVAAPVVATPKTAKATEAK